MRSFAIVLCSVFWGLTNSLQAEDPTAVHKRVYDEVNASAGSFDVIEKEIKLPGEEEASIVKAWTDEGAVRKLEVGDPGDGGNTIREYYYDEDGGLAFVYQTVTTESMQTGKVAAKVHARFYFTDGELIRYLDSDNKPVGKDDPSFGDYEEELLKLSKGYSKAVSKGSSANKSKEKSTGKQVTEGTYVGIEQGDYFHLNIVTDKGDEVSYFILHPDKTFDPFLKNPEKFAKKKVRVTWESKEENIPEAGGKMQVDSALSIELIK